jgi:hypothetical protein
VSNHQNGTVLVPPQQAKAQPASPKRPPPRGKNAERRPREFLTPDEVEQNPLLSVCFGVPQVHKA